MKTFRLFIAVMAFFFLASGCIDITDKVDQENDNQKAGTGNEKSELDPTDDAYNKPGPIGQGRYVLPNGRMVKPAGIFVETPTFTIDAAVSPDGNTVVVGATRGAAVSIYDVTTQTITQQFDAETNHAFTGIVFNAAGDRFWTSGGGDHSIYEFDLIGGVAVFLRRIPMPGWPSSLVLSNDENFLYTSLYQNMRMVKVNISTGKVVKSYAAHRYPYDVAIMPNEQIGFVTNLGRNMVSVFNLNTEQEIALISVGKHPEECKLSPDAKLLYVANSDSDSISVIDTSTYEVVQTWDLHDDEYQTAGAMPIAIEVSPDGSRLYVTCAGYDSVDVLDAANGKVLGRIPTGWYPTNAAICPINNKLFIAGGKGIGSAGYVHNTSWPGILQEVEIPDSNELALYTEDTEEGLRWAFNFYENWYENQTASPIPTEYGARSDKIKHVVFILKENKTYDQVLGDLAGTEGDLTYNQFGEAITPNTHALVREFANCDNFYVEGDISVMGHIWSTYAAVNDHMEKQFFAGPYPIPELDPASVPATDTIFNRMLDAGLDFRIYGEILGVTNDLEKMAPYINLHYGFWNMGTSDEHEKAEEIIREWELGIFPDFMFIVLPNDHNYGSSAGAPTPRYLMGDNDAGLGKLVDWISHSKYWDETVIFVTEDDPQSGSDHIDPHRTIGLAIGPWVKRNHLSSVLYSQSSMWQTISLILGMTPASKFDQYAAPMFDLFSATKDSTPYKYVTNPIPFELNGEDKFSHLYCRKPNWLVPDGAPGLGRVLWAMYKPGIPFPRNDSVDGYCNNLEEGEDEDYEADVRMYVDAVNKAVEYGKARGITVPVPQGWAELSAKIAAEKAAQ